MERISVAVRKISPRAMLGSRRPRMIPPRYSTISIGDGILNVEGA